jgi:small subunit ribosomal protein S20
MANSAQAKKRGRQIERRTEVNKARKSRIRTFLKKVDEALETGEEKLALDALKKAQPELMRGVSKGLMHKNTAARKMSRLSSRVKLLSQK